MQVCDDCIEISKRPHASNGRMSPWKVKCESCGAWWELTSVKTIRFSRFRGEWRRLSKYITPDIYSPVRCQQRRCLEHAHHKVQRGGRAKGRAWKYKCDRHAGVCIIV